jgi:hypothetical protein
MNVPYFKDAIAFISEIAKDGCEIIIPIPSIKVKDLYKQQLRAFLDSQPDYKPEDLLA